MKFHKGLIPLIIVGSVIIVTGMVLSNSKYIQGSLTGAPYSDTTNNQANRFNMRDCIDAYMAAPFSEQDNRGDARRWCRVTRRETSNL